jgi:peptidoglycan/LPS O-acetylase OafA/YrhL
MIRRLALWGTAAYGIYLSHALFVEAMFAIAGRAHLADSIPLKITEFFAALLLSAATVWVLNRSKGTRWLNG